MYHSYKIMPPKKAQERPVLAKFGSAFLGSLAGVAGIVAYPIVFTVSDAAVGARRGYHSSRSFPLKLIKGTWGFARGAVIGFGRGFLRGIAAPVVLAYFGWKDKLGDKLRNERDKAINDVRGPSRTELTQTDELDYNSNPPAFNRTLPPPDDDPELESNTSAILSDEPLTPKPSAPVLHQFPAATTITQPSDSTTAPITMTLTSIQRLNPDLSSKPKDIAQINALLDPKEHGTFSVKDKTVSFTGPDLVAALAKCQKSPAFRTLSNYGYQLTLPIDDMQAARKHLKDCNNMGIWITDCQIGEKTYTVNGDMLVPSSSPKLTP